MNEDKIPEQTVDLNKPNLIQGIAVSGEAMLNMADKKFTVVKAPYYENVKDMKHEDKEIKKLLVPVRLSDNMVMDYYPNKTSQKTLVAKFGFDMNKWINKAAEFEVIKQKVNGTDRQVLFVK